MNSKLWQILMVPFLLMFYILLILPSVCFGIEKSDAIAKGREAYNVKDYSRARDLFEIACKDGSNDGCFYLGYIFESGKGGNQSNSEASKWYNVAVERGSSLSGRDNPNIQFMYGVTFYKRALDDRVEPAKRLRGPRARVGASRARHRLPPPGAKVRPQAGAFPPWPRRRRHLPRAARGQDPARVRSRLSG